VTHLVSVSGGKDSTAMVILSRGLPSVEYVFADTGNEHAATYQYLDYLEDRLGIAIQRIKPCFRRQIENKRRVVETKWRKDGVPEEQIALALSMLQATGIPFLDLCIWKGRFPSSMARFCTEELKRNPIVEHAYMPLLAAGRSVVSWQGMRADESRSRAKLVPVEFVGTHFGSSDLYYYRPILRWTAEGVFALHRKAGVEPNPLYMQGMTRVGCMPCIHERKDSLLEIARRFPEEIDRIREWERMVGDASKRGASSFFPSAGGMHPEGFAHSGIDDAVDWAKTSRGGRQFDLLRQTLDSDAPVGCSSEYGLCE
jgi:3'-phosphoadenosine 5'-phosphosulfate sulfotransferase (PAPS reductase)/FAD synthetase